MSAASIPTINKAPKIMTRTLASRFSVAALALFAVLASFQQTLMVPGLVA